MGVTGKRRRRRPHDGLRHAELYIGAHEFDDGIENTRAIDQIDKSIVIAEQVTAIHETAGVEVGCVRQPFVVPSRQV